MNNYKKYLKYKYKYYALKKQIGGNVMEILYDNKPITINDESKDYYNAQIKGYETQTITEKDTTKTEEFIKDLIIYYILNTHTNSYNHACPNIKIEIDKINPKVLIDSQIDSSKAGINNHYTAYRYLYRQSKRKQANDSVTYFAEVPCGNPIDDQSLMDRAMAFGKNIRDTITYFQTTEKNMWEFITDDNIFTKIKESYKTIARERKDSKSLQHKVLLSDIFFWYVMINKMFINKIVFLKKFEPNFVLTKYSGSWEASSIKQQTLEADRQLRRQLSTRLNNFQPPLAPPPPSQPTVKDKEHQFNPFGMVPE
jgi:hypothetical protein